MKEESGNERYSNNLVCKECGGYGIQVRGWADANTYKFLNQGGIPDDTWCVDCEENGVAFAYESNEERVAREDREYEIMVKAKQEDKRRREHYLNARSSH